MTHPDRTSDSTGRALRWLPVLLLAGCVRTGAALFDPTASYASTCDRAIIIYASSAKAPAGYREIALLSSDATMKSDDDVLRDQRRKAAEIGATGILLNRVGDVQPAVSTDGTVSMSDTRVIRSVAIFVAGDSARVRAACAATPPS